MDPYTKLNIDKFQNPNLTLILHWFLILLLILKVSPNCCAVVVDNNNDHSPSVNPPSTSQLQKPLVIVDHHWPNNNGSSDNCHTNKSDLSAKSTKTTGPDESNNRKEQKPQPMFRQLIGSIHWPWSPKALTNIPNTTSGQHRSAIVQVGRAKDTRMIETRNVHNMKNLTKISNLTMLILNIDDFSALLLPASTRPPARTMLASIINNRVNGAAQPIPDSDDGGHFSNIDNCKNSKQNHTAMPYNKSLSSSLHQIQHFVKRRSTMLSSLKQRQQSLEELESSAPTHLNSSNTRMGDPPLMLPLVGGVDTTERTYVIGWEGFKTSLPCNVTSTGRASNDSIDLILWFRGQDTRALYSIDARRAPTMQRAKHFTGDEVLGARAFIDLTTRPTSLVIESVKAQDAGEYRCRVDFRRSPSEHRSVMLDVLTPPKEVIIMDEFGQRLNDPITPFNEGAHLNLICEAEGGKPRPLLFWFGNDQLLDDQWTITAQGIVRNELFLPKLKRSDQNKMLTCQALLNVSDESIAEMFPSYTMIQSSSFGSGSVSTSTASSSSSNSFRNYEKIRLAMLANPSLIGLVGGAKFSNLLKLKQSQSSILLDLNLRPLNVRITTVHRPLIDGQIIVINCESDGARPPALLSWWKSSQRLERAITEEVITIGGDSNGDGLADIINRTISTIQFLPTIQDNGKVLSCRADHSVLSDSSLEDSWLLNVLFTPKLTISFGAAIQHDNIHEMSNVSLECHVAANPPVSEIGWLFEGRRLSLGVDAHNRPSINQTILHHYGISGSISWIEMHANTLLIYHIDRKHSGRYRCVAANAQGEGQSEEILLKVQYKPVCARGQRSLFGVAQREPLQVPCTVESDPEEVTFRWMFNSSQSESLTMIPIDNFQVPQQAGLLGPKTRTSIAHYEPKTRYGYGQLLCYATNKLGEQSDPCRFDIIPAGQPQPLRDCSVRNQSADSLVVKCQPSDDGGLDQIFHMEVFLADQGQMIANLTTDHHKSTSESHGSASSFMDPDGFIEFVVREIPVSTTYVLLLYASNAKGRSNYVTLSATTTPPGGRGSEFSKFTADFGIKPMMYLLVTVVASLVISAIIIVIVSKVRTINKAKSRHRALAPFSAQKSNKNISNGSFASNCNNQQTTNLDTLEFDPTLLDNASYDQQALEQHSYSQLMDLTAGPNGRNVHSSLIESLQSSPYQELMFQDSIQQISSCGSISLNHHLYKSPFGSDDARVVHATRCSPRINNSNQPNHLNVIIKNPMIELSSGQSPSSLDSSSQPPPMYHTVYADADPYIIHAASEHPPANHDSTRSADDQVLLMDISSYYHHNRQPATVEDEVTSRVGSASQAAVLNYATSCTTGSITWSQAETLALGAASSRTAGCSSSQPGGLLSPASPLSTLSVPFPHQQSIEQATILVRPGAADNGIGPQSFQLQSTETTNSFEPPGQTSGELVNANNNSRTMSASESIVSTAV